MENAQALIATWDFLRLVYERADHLSKLVEYAAKWRTKNTPRPMFGYDEKKEGTWPQIAEAVAVSASAVEDLLRGDAIQKHIHSFTNWDKLFQDGSEPISTCQLLHKHSENLLLELTSNRREIETVDYWKYQSTLFDANRSALGRAMIHLEQIQEVRSHALQIARDSRRSSNESENVTNNQSSTDGTEESDLMTKSEIAWLSDYDEGTLSNQGLLGPQVRVSRRGQKALYSYAAAKANLAEKKGVKLPSLPEARKLLSQRQTDSK